MNPKLWQHLKELTRAARPIVYALNPDGKEDKHPIQPVKVYISKHQASKRGYAHQHNGKVARRADAIPSQHERVVALRKQRDPQYAGK
jgi:hypothetical protein